jgi:hypothetical protein
VKALDNRGDRLELTLPPAISRAVFPSSGSARLSDGVIHAGGKVALRSEAGVGIYCTTAPELQLTEALTRRSRLAICPGGWAVPQQR